MKTKNIITLIVSILILAVLGFGVWWLVKNKDAVFGYVNNSNIYTQDEYDKHYQEGYDQGYQDANNNEDYYKKLLAQYESQLAEKNASLEEYQKQQEKLLAEKNDLQSQLDTANSELEAVQPTIDALEQEIAENEATMLELESEKAELEQSLSAKTQELENVNALLTQANSDIEELEAEIDRLEGLDTENTATINALKSELALVKEQKTQLENDKTLLTNNLNSVKTQLEDTQALYENLQQVNSSNMTTITNLNNRIVALNTTISELTYQLQNSSSNTTALNNKIAELQASIEYYKSYIASLENGSQVVATYEYDGSVINIQLVAPGSKLSINAPEDTIYITLNGWQKDGVGEYIDFNTFVITENTYFVANLTYKFDVKFMSDVDTEYDSQLIVKDNYATEPVSDPVREGYVFKGWSKDGVTIIEDINTTAVTEHTTYYAVWNELHTVTYMEGSGTLKTMEVENGDYSVPPTTTNTAYKTYNGWLVNSASADPTTYKIVADTIFVADITYSYDVVYMNGDTQHDSQIVVENGYSTLPTEPIKADHLFLGWSLTPNGEVVSNITTTPVTGTTTYYAVFKLNKFDVKFMLDPSTEYDSQSVTGGNCATEPETGPTKAGYVFKGWALTQNGEVVENINSTPVTENTTYYAVFEYVEFGIFSNGNVEYTWDELIDNEYLNNTGGTLTANETFKSLSLSNNAILKISDEITIIGDDAFRHVTNLYGVEIPESIVKIGDDAFAYTQLDYLYYNAKNCADLTSSDEPFFQGISSFCTITIGNKVERIPAYLFYAENGNYTYNVVPQAKTLVFEENSICTSIGNFAFRNCMYLETITIPETITEIGQRAFAECVRLKNVYYNAINCTTLPSTSSSIFLHCGSTSKSIKITIGSSVQHIPSDLLDMPGDNYFTDISFAENSQLVTIGSCAFASCKFTDIVVPSGVTTIGKAAFGDNDGLETVYIPASVETIGAQLFSEDTNVVVYCELDSKPSGWDSGWNSSFYGDVKTVEWGVTYEEYLEIIGG